MTQRLILTVAVAMFASLASLDVAYAQRFYGGSSDNPNGPTVSPYLNLLQNDNPNLTNYQSLVRPLINQNNAIRRQGGAIQQLQQQGYGAPPAGATGVHSYFMYYSHFYPGARR